MNNSSVFKRVTFEVAMAFEDARRGRNNKRQKRAKERGCRFEVGDILYRDFNDVRLYFLVTAPGIPGLNEIVYAGLLGRNYMKKRVTPGDPDIADRYTKSWRATRKYKKFLALDKQN